MVNERLDIKKNDSKKVARRRSIEGRKARKREVKKRRKEGRKIDSKEERNEGKNKIKTEESKNVKTFTIKLKNNKGRILYLEGGRTRH